MVPYIKVSNQLNAYISKQPPQEAALLIEFNKAATVVAKHLSRDECDEATQATVQGAFQQAAQAAAKVDPAFYSFYNQFWSWDLGPLEAVPKVGS